MCMFILISFIYLFTSVSIQHEKQHQYQEFATEIQNLKVAATNAQNELQRI
jgi:hypothetical protein